MTTTLEKPTKTDTTLGTALALVNEDTPSDTETITITDIFRKIIKLENREYGIHRNMAWCAHFFHDFLDTAKDNEIIGQCLLETFIDLLDDFQNIYQRYVFSSYKNSCNQDISDKNLDKKLITHLDNKIRDFTEIENSTETLRTDIKDKIFELAERKNYCTVYDEFATEWGLPTIPRNRIITATITLTTCCADMGDDQAAQELIERISEVDISDIEVTLDE